MKRYIEQLIEDLDVARCNAADKLSGLHTNTFLNEYIPFIDDDHKGIRVADLIGLEQFVFPRLSLLSNIEVTELCQSLIEVYKAYGLNPIFSPCVPDLIRYGQLREHIKHHVYPQVGSMVDIELCDYIPPDCPFFKICPSTKNGAKCCSELQKRA
ncbi:hypothetical protein [Carboxylicivirga sp. N1Y90]|uniref:hypothetical protein n=1 Tax=Carboxylicivirga fragile TaxID=3417571 RepID=UPI003D355951|nr:hypothetical protein [Marinilabiliaceae bacterium N1Y90]